MVMTQIVLADLLTIQPHTPSPEPKKYQRNGGDWYNQDTKETNGTLH